MVTHQSFFSVLASEESGSPAWNAALAGLAVLRLVDEARTDPAIIDTDWTGLRAVTETISSLREGAPFKRALTKVVDDLRDPGSSWSAITKSVLAYGRALDVQGHWSLAADVFGTVADTARAERDPELAMEATIALGGAARRTGDWDLSAGGYADAAHLANALGDKESGLTARVGMANTQVALGNLPAAGIIFEEVIFEASRSGLDGVEALALHRSASLSHLKGRFADAVRLGYRAIEKTTNPSVRDGLMADIAAALVSLGMWEAARDAHMIVSLTARYQWVRWQATVNLMELAAMEGMEAAFDDYASELKSAALDPRLRSYFLLYYGQGCMAFERDADAANYLAQARDFASRHKINQVAFMAEEALNGSGTVLRERAKGKWTDAIPPEVGHVVEALAHLRENAVMVPASSDWM